MRESIAVKTGILLTGELKMVLPIEVQEAVAAIAKTGREAIVKKEHGKWIVLENGRRIVYRENK